MKRLIFFVALLLGLTGCATDYSKLAPAEIASQVQVRGGEFDVGHTHVAPVVSGGEPFAPSWRARLVGLDNPERGWSEGLSVIWNYSGPRWLFFDGADASGYPNLHFYAGNREVGSCGGLFCSYQENVHALVPRALLEASTQTGLRFRFRSRGGAVMLELPANYIAGYLMATKNAYKPAAAPAPAQIKSESTQKNMEINPVRTEVIQPQPTGVNQSFKAVAAQPQQASFHMDGVRKLFPGVSTAADAKRLLESEPTSSVTLPNGNRLLTWGSGGARGNSAGTGDGNQSVSLLFDMHGAYIGVMGGQ